MNSLAPFVLNSKLVPLMAATAAASARGAYVVNVSAMEVWPTEGTSRFTLTTATYSHVVVVCGGGQRGAGGVGGWVGGGGGLASRHLDVMLALHKCSQPSRTPVLQALSTEGRHGVQRSRVAPFSGGGPKRLGSIVMLWMQGKFYRHKTEFHPHTNMYVCCDFCVGWVGASCAGMHVSAAVSCEHLCVYVCGRLWAFVDVCRRLCTYACTFVHVCVYVCARLCTFVHGFVRLRVCLCAGVCLRMLVSAHMCARVCTASVPWTAQGQGRLEHDDSHLCPGPLHAEHLYDVCGHRVDQ